MIKRLKRICLLLVGLFFVSVPAIAQNNYKVTFYIHDLPDDTLYIQSYCGYKTEIADSAIRSQDKGFHFTLNDYPMGMYMAKTNQGDLFTFLLDLSKSFTIEIYPNGEYYVENSPENDQYLMYQQANQQCQRDMEQYKLLVKSNPEKFDSLKSVYIPKLDTFEAFQKQFFATYPYNFASVVNKAMQQVVPSQYVENNKVKPEYMQQYAIYMRAHYWDNFEFRDKRMLYSPYFIKQFSTYISNLTVQVPDSVCRSIDDFVNIADSRGGKEYADYVIAMYLDEMGRLPFSFNEMIFSYLIKKYSDRVSMFLPPSLVELYNTTAQELQPFLPGNVIPNLNLKDFNGVSHKLYSLKNQYTVLYFFSATCESCKKNLDDLKNFYKDYKDKYDVQIYSVDIEPEIAIGRGRQIQDPFDWIVVHADAEELAAYNFHLDHTPELYILDKDKRIINKTAIYSHVKQTIELDIENHKQNK